MRQRIVIIAWMLALAIGIPQIASARYNHYFNCSTCHRGGFTLQQVTTGQLCMSCHQPSPPNVTLNDNTDVAAHGLFSADDASDALGSNPPGPGYKGTSHMFWGGEYKAEAGAEPPSLNASLFNGRYGITRGNVTCSRCHTPHADNITNPQLLKVGTDSDTICVDCHRSWNVANADAPETHPSGIIYADYESDTARFKLATEIPTTAGDVRLVSGKVSCTSCHGVHFTDSDSSTADGMGILPGSAVGDGHLLRTDGPRDFASASSSDFTLVEATKRSNVCQACHTYKVHGKNDGAADLYLGCTDCHSGHSHNAGDPFYYILRKTTFNPLPAYNAAVTFTGYRGVVDYIYNSIDSTVPVNKSGVWNDGSDGTADGYCEACHGDAKDIPGSTSHTTAGICTDCHFHNSSGWDYSFKPDVSAATCGDCHGFPPHLSVAGNHPTEANPGGTGTLGGYAYSDPDGGWNYNTDSGYYKDEALTPHLTHAGGHETNYPNYYFVGLSGTDNCNACHGDNSGFNTRHRNADSVAVGAHAPADPTSFRDVPFNAVAQIPSGPAPVYDDETGGSTWTCDNIYCHTNGGPADDAGARSYLATTTPSWVGGSPGEGRDAFFGDPATRCQHCHGNDGSDFGDTMTGKANSAAHLVHLEPPYSYSCNLCHNDTALDKETLQPLATLGNKAGGGEHVNGSVEVTYNSSAWTGAFSGATWTAASGTCSVYCHGGATPDWQKTNQANCGSCHGTTSATLTTGSHTRHLNPSGANLVCDECHGLGASTGSHSGHVDGTVTKETVSDSCDVCHGVENSAAWDVSPTWGIPGSVDCRTCHQESDGGNPNSVTSYTDAGSFLREVSVANGTDKSAFASGHGKGGVGKVCSDCHNTTYTTSHMDATGGDNRLLTQGGFNFETGGQENSYCNDCHATPMNIHFGNANTPLGSSDDALFCYVCHDPHGAPGGQDTMIRDTIAGRSVTNFYNSALRADYYVDPPGASYGVCQVCHDDSEVGRFNWTTAETGHQSGPCTDCHLHTNDPGFVGNASSCDGCHGSPPTLSTEMPNLGNPGPHEIHAVASTYNALDPGHDASDCAACHPNAELYTYDIGNGHRDGSLSLDPGIVYNSTFDTYTCSIACHASTLTDGSWTDTSLGGNSGDGLACTACHNDGGGNPQPATGKHDTHVAGVGLVCDDCHLGVESQGTGLNWYIHNDPADTSTEYNSVLTQGRDYVTPDDAEVSDAAYNSAVSTWNDTDNSCSNTDCHDPSQAGNVADWDSGSSAGNCAFCHNDGGGNPEPATGSHGAHMDPNLDLTFGRTIGCDDCHTTNGVNTAHRDGALGIVGNTFVDPNCTASTCHQDGKGSNVPSPDWGSPSTTVCATCHNDGGGNPQPATGRHAGHIGNAAYVAGSCGECHLDATPTAITAGTHLNGSVQAGDAGIALTATDGTTCTNACHDVDATGTWTDGPATLDCIECHTAGKIGTAPASGLHTGTLVESDNTHDVSFQATRNEGVPSGTCTTCHTGIDIAGNVPAAHIAGGAPSAAEAALNVAALSYTNGSPSTCAPTNALAACHDDGGAWNRRWSVTAKNADTSRCTNCHGTFDSPGGFVTGMSQRHSLDPQIIGGHNGTEKCYICHTYDAAETHYTWATDHRNGVIRLNENMLFVDDGDTVHCDGCHAGGALGLGDGQYSFEDTYNSASNARWGRAELPGPAANCVTCHETDNGLLHGGTNENSAVHAVHTGSPLTPGCAGCHPHSGPGSPGDAVHIDNFVNFGGTYLTETVGYNYNAATGNFPNTNCTSVNGCHDSEPDSWTLDTIQCADCHAASSKAIYINDGLSGWDPPTSGAHIAHSGNDALIGATPTSDCDDCHGAGASNPDVASLPSGHSNGIVTFNSASVVSYNATNGTCSNDCHAGSADWRDSLPAPTCADCHAGGGSLAQGTVFPPDSAKHAEHIGNDAYVTGDCADCHGAGAATGAHTGHKNATVDNTVTYNSTNQNCTIACHVVTTGDWSAGGSLACRDCHDGGHVAPAPASGLHTVSVATTHDETLQGGNCINCHDATDPSTSHIAGGAAQGWAAGLYNFNANVASYNSAVGCAADCHGDRFGNGGAGKWSRRWIGVEDDTPDGHVPGDAVCGNCHGDFASGWRAGITVSHVNPYAGNDPDDDMNQHSGCEKCHGWNNANYDETYGGTSPAHGDGNITMNGPASTSTGAGYNSATGGCTQACHGEEYVMLPTDSGWTENYGDFGGGDCDSCHAGNSPPRDHGDVATENATTHNLHATSSLVGGCTACHPHNGSVTPGTEPHGTGTVNFTNQMAAGDDYSVSGFEVSNCSTNNCHVSDSGDWTAVSNPLVCTDCHNNTKALRPTDVHPPTSGRHTMHIDNDTYVGTTATDDCDACHGAGAETGSHSGHRSGGAINTVVSYLNGTCTNTCHNASLTDNWTTVDLACADCHNNTGMSLDVYPGQTVDANTAPTTGMHGLHMGQVGAKGNYVPASCAGCHGHDGVFGDGADVHLDGSTTVGGVVASYNSTQATCVNSCHVGDTVGDWTGGTLACADCHAGGGSLDQLGVFPPTSAKHGLHMGQDGAKGDYVPNGCSECHGANAMTGGHGTHKDGAIDTDPAISYNSGSQTCSISCHQADTSGDWTVGGALACADCHDGAGHVGQLNKDNASGLHIAGNATQHDDSSGVGITCTSCHDTMPAGGTHKDGFTTDPVGTFGLFAGYNSTNSDCAATCHDDQGQWRRLWNAAVDADPAGADSGSDVCNNCHGQYSSLNAQPEAGWREGTVHYRSGIGTAEDKGESHNKGDANNTSCNDCHAYDRTVSVHQDGNISFSGADGAPDTYTLTSGATGWYCSGASCHDGNAGDDAAQTDTRTFLDSLTTLPRAYVLGNTQPEGSCTTCHGNDTNGSNWPDDSTAHAVNDAGAHPEHVHAIAAEIYNTASPTVAQQNTTCDYCHPTNTHEGGFDGGDNLADVSRTDTDNDNAPELYNSTTMKYIIGGGIDNGTGGAVFHRDEVSGDGRCSMVDCHANAPYTPGWYGDTVVPGQVTTLAAATHNTIDGPHVVGETDDPGTVLLTWDAPGDDNGDDGTAYRYDVRYRAFGDGAVNDANWDEAGVTLQAGGVPTVDRMGKAQEMVVDGLVPGQQYYFGVKTSDEAGLWSVVSNSDSAFAHADDMMPIFWGVNRAEVHDIDGRVNLDWDAAKDHSQSYANPIDYMVWWSTYALKTHLNNGGTLPAIQTCYNVGSPPVETACGGSEDYQIDTDTTHALRYQATGLDLGVLYNFLVRAQDPVGNIDDNTATALAIPLATAKIATSMEMYLANASGGLVSDPDPANPTWPGEGSVGLSAGTSTTWVAGNVLPEDTNVTGLSFDIFAETRKGGTITYELGYATSGGSWVQALGNVAPVSRSLGKNSKRVQKLGLFDFVQMVPINNKLAVRITAAAGNADTVTLRFGTDAYKGQLMVNEQPFNHAPSAVTGLSVTEQPTGGYLDLSWGAGNANDSGQTVHYDVYGSIDGGATYPYIIATDLTATSTTWDTVGDGLGGFNGNVTVKVAAGDGLLYETSPGSDVFKDHEEVSTNYALDNSSDTESPAAVTIESVETRPKQGSVYLTWSAVGNDGLNHGTRAAEYDVRVSTSLIADGTAYNALTLPENLVEGEPAPTFSGFPESMEILGLQPDTTYYFAMKVRDEANNWGPMSNVLSTTSGAKCGICHSTPPDEPATAGTHAAHGYTINDCAKCHGDQCLTFDVAHQDGKLLVGWARESDGTPIAPVEATIVGDNVYYEQNVPGTGLVRIYDDVDGAGGVNRTGYYDSPAGYHGDSGTCMNFVSGNVTGCHGAFNPRWADGADGPQVTPVCADCHGNKDAVSVYPAGRATDPYQRVWDDNTADVPNDPVLAAPPVDNHGQSTGNHVGAHLKHLNASFRFAKGDSCRLCHKDTEVDGLHADGNPDVIFDVAAWKDEVTPAGYNSTTNTCSNLNANGCHDTGATWDSAATAKCNECHGMAGKTYDVPGNSSTIGHVYDASTVQLCTYCHVAGHPQSPDGSTPGDPNCILIPNNAAVGINYRSGGIHLKKAIGSHGTYSTEAEICWACHADASNNISEWGTNTQNATGSSLYNYGDLSGTTNKSWVGATWTSGKTEFAYKTGLIQSTHTTDPAGTSSVSWNATYGRYEETVDSVDKIHCSNCHDVHDSNKAADDTLSGAPYLRGTWMGNPYEEDGAPWSKDYGTPTYSPSGAASNRYGAIPRGGTAYGELGGYFIDQNNVTPGTTNADHYPTSGWTVQSSAGLCLLCHKDVNSMDQTKGENLWLGTGNGHSNAAVGGTFDPGTSTNIFDFTHGRPTPVQAGDKNNRPGGEYTSQVPSMGYLSQTEVTAGLEEGHGYRGTVSTSSYSGGYIPNTNPSAKAYGFNDYDWGASVDDATTDGMFHQFSCSKCHNPHASRLPKLMVTNCLDIRHNTWDDGKSSLQTKYTASALTAVDSGMPAAYYASAQNCHRFDGRRTTTTLRGGWNKVTPWVFDNLTNAEHKGSADPAYSDAIFDNLKAQGN